MPCTEHKAVVREPALDANLHGEAWRCQSCKQAFLATTPETMRRLGGKAKEEA